MTTPQTEQDWVRNLGAELGWWFTRLPRTLVWVLLWLAYWSPWLGRDRTALDAFMVIAAGLATLTALLYLLGMLASSFLWLMWILTPWGDIRTARRRRASKTLIDMAGLFDHEADRRHPGVKITQTPAFTRLSWPTSLRAETTETINKTADRLYGHLGALWHTVEPLKGRWVLTWHTQPMPDLLAGHGPLDAPMPWHGDWSSLPYGTRIDGTQATFCVANISGTVVGGLPGCGKTAGLSTLLAPLVASDSVQFCIWDGKGGADWSWIDPRASLFSNDDEDFEQIADQLEALVEAMRDRIKNMRHIRGGSNLWNTGGPSPDLPLLVIIIDECHTWLDAKAIPKTDKEKLALRQRIETAIATLIRKGRAVGIWVLVATQKPTSDSLPTTIGSNAALSICLRVKTPDAEKAVIGSLPAEDDPRATALPFTPGYAVVAAESGGREVVRFGYIPEDRLETLAVRYAYLAQPVISESIEPKTEPEPEPEFQGADVINLNA